ncbi:MAG TPA: M20/M25/M40 family metallo-hydrolase [Gaiellaceae bacterium]|jgi:tripeptide aminopeptidase|nr:M20/M25/M40 family metallo-hydrolase [Gaiellaceae bacterium]
MPDVVELFTDLAALPSPPGEEREVADRVTLYLRELGLEVDEDDAGPRVGSTAGNLLCRLEPTVGAGLPVFFCAHLDTVPPDGPIEPVLEDGVVTNAEPTILGADNKAAVAAMLDATRRVVEDGRPHAGLELLFTPKEEVGLQGAAAFDHTRLTARLGYVYDQAAPIGEVILGAPYSESMEVRFHGRASHSGMYPEEGRSAIAAAAKAIADLRLGRVDEETTANVGLIHGGTAGNIVPEWCTFLAEARSHDERKLADLVQEMLDAFTFAAGVGECEVETSVHKSYRGYRFRRDDLPVRLAAAALERSGFAPSYALSGGAADANVFNERGLPCVNLANGMANIHTSDESIAVSDLEAMVEVTLALVDVAREATD